MTTIILASQSPRRAALLQSIGIEFTQRGFDVDETVHEGELPKDFILRIIADKYQAAIDHYSDSDKNILVADTIVVLDNTIYGKPKDDDDAKAMLRALSGTTHEVMTGIRIGNKETYVQDAVVTKVSFAAITDNEINRYVASGEPLGKAGAYAIQGLASVFVNRIEGSYSNIVGLPLYETATLLKKVGVNVL